MDTIHEYVSTYDLTKDWFCLTGQEILDVCLKKVEELDNVRT